MLNGELVWSSTSNVRDISEPDFTGIKLAEKISTE